MKREGSVPRKEAGMATAEDRERRKALCAAALGAQEPAPSAGVKVVCRLRPMNERERRSGTVPAATASTERKEVAVVRMLGGTRKVSSTFHFDDVLTSFSTQSEVFSCTLEPLINEVLHGYEATAFAYGQTGTGKTYTMEGEVESIEGRGLVPRAAAAVIHALTGGKYSDFAVTVSYLEIYNEELSDLLVPAHLQQKLDLKDSGGGRGVCCQGLSEVPVASVADILELVHRAQERRRVAETRINARSSRSHSIFTMKVRCRRAIAAGELENVGKLHLVDLAGSECAKKATPSPAEAGAGGPRPGAQTGASEEERERKSINQSLLTLGRVITALRDGSGRVPYRDSKLTRLLQDSLGGRCKTVIIATISPALGAVEETISTLTYAEQASGIQNRPMPSSLLRTLRMATTGEVKGDGSGTAQGTNDFAELEMKVVYLSQEVEEAQAALARQYREAQEQAERAQSAEERLAAAEEELREARHSIEEGAFVRKRLLGFVDHQTEVASQFSAALQAAGAHCEAVTSRLVAGRAEALEARRQARETCAAAGAEGAAVAGATGERAAEAAKALDETHSAHAAATANAEEVSKSQLKLLEELLAGVRECSARLSDKLGGISAEARKAADADQAAAKDALVTIEAAANSVLAAAGKLKADAAATTARDVEALGLQADALGEELNSGREALSAGVGLVVQDVAAARETGSKGHELACKRLRKTLQEPLVSLEAALQQATQRAQTHSASSVAVREAGAEDARRAAERRRGLLEALASAAAAHGASADARPAALGAVHEALRSALEAHGEAVAGSLSSQCSRLEAARAELVDGTERGFAALSSAVKSADGQLAAAWTAEAGCLQRLEATLAESLAELRSSHAAKSIQEAAASAAAALSAALDEAVGELAVAREHAAGQVAELQQQRSAEQQIVELLRQQREGLQADVAGQRATLEEVRQELAAAHGELAALQAQQEERRKRALEAIMSVVSSELGGLGQELAASAEATRGRLQAVSQLASQAGEAAVAAEQRSASLGEEVAGVAREWSQAVDFRCGALGAAQERVRAAAEAAEAASAAAGEALAGLGAAGVAWGEGCDRVAQHVEEASQRRLGLASALEALQPEWGAVREVALGAAAGWAEGGRRVEGSLVLVATDGTNAASKLEGLRGAVAARCAAAVEEAGTWRRDGETHSAALAQLAARAEGLAAEAEEAERRRAIEAENCSQEAQDLAGRAATSWAEAGALLGAAAAHAEAAPVDFAAGDAALAAAAAAAEVLGAQASAAFAAGATGVTALRTAQAAAANAAHEGTAVAADALAAAAKAGGAVAAAHREAASAALSHMREQWQRGDEERRAALAALGAAAETAGSSAHGAAEAASRRLRSELGVGAGAKDRAAAALEALSSGTASSLDRLQAALRAGLAERPLTAFSEDLGPAVPERPKAAAWPEIEALPRPCEEQLALEFRGAARGREAQAPFNDAENLGQPRPAAAAVRAGAEKKLLGPKEAWVGGGGDAAGPLPRRALAELNGQVEAK